MYIYLSQTAHVIDLPTCVSVSSEEDGRVVCRDGSGAIIAIFPHTAVVTFSRKPIPVPDDDEESTRRQSP